MLVNVTGDRDLTPLTDRLRTPQLSVMQPENTRYIPGMQLLCSCLGKYMCFGK